VGYSGYIRSLLCFAAILAGTLCADAQTSPHVHTQPAGPITTTNATLNGMVAANDNPAAAWFEWGERGSFTHSTLLMDVAPTTSVFHLSAPISGLIPGGVYQYRLMASNTSVTVTGWTKYFTTGRKMVAWGGSTSTPTNFPPDATNLVQVSAGYGFGTALSAEGRVFIWGPSSSTPTNLPSSLSNVMAVAAGNEFALALRTNRTVVAWGTGPATNVPSNLSNVVMIAASMGAWPGFGFGLALNADGRIVAWGENSDHQTNVPTGLSNVVAISAGRAHSLALRADGKVFAWGYETNVPASASNMVAIAAGGYNNEPKLSVALKADGKLVVWSSGVFSELITGATSISNVAAITAGGYHAVALRPDGTLVAWGDNRFGQTNVPPGLINCADISAGNYFSLVLANLMPQANSVSVTNAVNQDCLLSLTATDANSDPLSLRITTLPITGSLFQYTGNGRGSAIVLPDTPVMDSFGRVVFAPETGASGWPYSSFIFVANDGEVDSAPAAASVNIIPELVIDASSLSVEPNGAFSLNFSCNSNATCRVWASTNLMDWSVLGTASQSLPGVFHFIDSTATEWPERFYRVTCP
jgi:hypothetical protein